MKRRVAWPAVVVAATVAVGWPAAPAAEGSCVGSHIAVGEPIDGARYPTSGGSLSRGQPVIVSGVWFHSGCDDTGYSTGCGAGPQTQSTEAPLKGVNLVLKQGTSAWVLDTRDASGKAERYSVTWRGQIPQAARPGRAHLVADSATLPVVLTG